MPKSPKTNDAGKEKPISLDLLRKTLAEHASCMESCRQPNCRERRACHAIALGDGRRCQSPAWPADYDRLAERLLNLYETAFVREPPGWGLAVHMARAKLDRLIARTMEEEEKRQARRRRRRNGRPPVDGPDDRGPAGKRSDA